ncbi:MAG: uncharacterized membrane protein (UPF0127 family) [Phycisphaerales bacterium]|jgi:uncharacterized membrane protein (UPF0127 family)
MADLVNPKRTIARVLAGLVIAVSALTLGLTLKACVGPGPAVAPTTMAVTISGSVFNLDLAIDEATRNKGLGDRTSIAPTGGMLFSFKTSDKREFVMRDCVIPIDIIFLDGTGRVTNKHKMTVEPPRGEGEGISGDYQNRAYSLRLKRYSSRYSAKYAIELAGNTLDTLKIEIGDQIELDTKTLDRFTR